MTGMPVLSIVTWAPFVAALVIMAWARHRPRLVRWTAAVGAGVPLALAIWLSFAYDRAAAGFRKAVDEGSMTGLFSCSKATNELNFAAQKFSRVALRSNNIDSCNRT